MKEQCAVITAYKSVKMLKCLLKALHNKMRCFVFVDKTVWDKFKPLKAEFPDVFMAAPFIVRWGGMEHLEEILWGMANCLDYDFSYVHIISGEDYPAIPVDKIMAFFDEENGIYSDCNIIGDNPSWKRRYTCRWPYIKMGEDYKYNGRTRLFNYFCVGVQEILPFLKRCKIGDFEKVYLGFIWASYPKDAVQYLLDFLKRNPQFWKDLQTCKIPEELCFPTILMNSPLRSRMQLNNLRYWNMQTADGWGPGYLTIDEIKKLEDSDYMFVRKIAYDSETRKVLEARQISK